MTDLKTFLKVVDKFGYPNPNLVSIANMSGYELDNFLVDLQKEFGNNKKVVDFCDKAIEKLCGEKGLRVDLSGGFGEYAYVKIYPMYYDKKESHNDVISKYSWGESRILADEDGEEGYFTIEEIIENAGMGEWGDLEELLEHIRSQASTKIFTNCGFGIWWE